MANHVFLSYAREDIEIAQRIYIDLISIYCRRFGDEERQLACGLDVDGQGNIVITGSFWGSVDFGGGVLRASDDRNIFLAKFNSECRHLWSRSYGNSGEQVG